MMHMHMTDWYLLSRNGKPPPPWEDCLKETFFVYPDERILVAGHFADYTGKFVIHCHMLDHEDHGLMTQFEVVNTEGSFAGAPARCLIVLRATRVDATRRRGYSPISSMR